MSFRPCASARDWKFKNTGFECTTNKPPATLHFSAIRTVTGSPFLISWSGGEMKGKKGGSGSSDEVAIAREIDYELKRWRSENA
jgi:hypothetical protein